MNTKALEQAFKGNLDLFLFYLKWIEKGLNASKAYKELHPDVDEHSARVLGSRTLAKVNKELVLQAYGLDLQTYFQQLQDALQATKWNDFTGEREADHSTRKPYHDKLGKLLNLERDGNTVIDNSTKILVVPSEFIEKYDLSSITEPSSEG